MNRQTEDQGTAENCAQSKLVRVDCGVRGNWWCPSCKQYVLPQHVTYEETHDTRTGGCGGHVFGEANWNDLILGDNDSQTAPVCNGTVREMVAEIYRLRGINGWEYGYVAGIAAAIRTVESEPEYPGEAPPKLCAVLDQAIIDKDRDLLLHAMRETVRLTKQCIIERLTSP